MEKSRARIKVDKPRCPFCHEAVDAEEDKRACDACMAWHHAECWTEHGRCATCGLVAYLGLAEAPSPEPSSDLSPEPSSGAPQPLVSPAPLAELAVLLGRLDDESANVRWAALSRIGELGAGASEAVEELERRAGAAEEEWLREKFQQTIERVEGRARAEVRGAFDWRASEQGVFSTVAGLLLVVMIGLLLLSVYGMLKVLLGPA